MYEELGNDGIPDIATHFDKGTRNIISKLVQLKVYIKPEPIVKRQDKKTVKMMLNEMEELLEIEIDGQNVMKKENLEKIYEAIKDKLATSN